MIDYGSNRRNQVFNSRYKLIIGAVLLLMLLLGIRLFILTVIQHDIWTNEATDQSTKSIYTAAPRGDILDRNGTVIATDKQVFTVTFSPSGLDTSEINDSCIKLINILVSNGDKFTDDFPIKITSDGSFQYTYMSQRIKWLNKMGFSTKLTAAQAFRSLRNKYHIDSSLNRYDALTELQEKHNMDPPISVKTMTYTYDIEKEQFLTKWGYTADEIKKGISAKSCFEKLRKSYSISSTLTDEQARKIFIIRNEIATNGFTRYIPITIAKDISKKTIAYIEEADIPGVDISSEYERYYPKGKTACHIIGYMGAISESESNYYVDKLGYTASDLVGKDGIEGSMESKLHGTAGVTKIQANSSGEYVATVSKTDPKKGDDVYLTIDLDLQKTAEASLKNAINKIGACQSGAAVAIDVKTGDVLAMSSYPTYNPNIFANGISTKAWESVQSKNSRDPLSPAPLYNNATHTSVAPGSTFKPITAITALECGLDPNQSIYDRGVISYGNREWACSAYNDYGGNHGSETLEWGIGNSCNYYFYCIATGKDWGTGASLGYSKKISVDRILSTAKQFGLGSKTGIELSESITPLASAERKMDSYRISLWNALYDKAYSYFPKSIYGNYDKLTKNLDTICNWIYDNPSYAQLCTWLKDKTDIKDNKIDDAASIIKYDYFIQAQWTVGDQFNISIGQGDNAYTPLQLANYIATIGNGGVHNQVSIIKGVENEGLTKKSTSTTINLKSDTLDEVIKGMRRVCTSGTLSGVFGNFPVPVAGKTGTAENQGVPQPASEVKYIKKHLDSFNSAAGTSVTWAQVTKQMKYMMDKESERYASEDDTIDEALIQVSKHKISQSMINRYKGSYDYYSWTVALAPADNPKIAVAVLLIQGGFSSNAAPVAKDIIADYLDVYGDNTNKDTTDSQGTGENTIQ